MCFFLPSGGNAEGKGGLHVARKNQKFTYSIFNLTTLLTHTARESS